jgi:alkylation response protein AidB-like acyl-CoA dehydrogenase
MSLDHETSLPANTPSNTSAPSSPGPKTRSKSGESFAEVALRLGGASAEEARRTGVLDTADDQVEDLFAPQYQTAQSPAHRAIWDTRVPTDLFQCHSEILSEDVEHVIQKSLNVVRKHSDQGTLLNQAGKISDIVLDDLGNAGYWGLLVDKQYGGTGASMKQFSKMITRMATLDPTVAGLASVHGCIGAVDPVRSFGTPEQRKQFLPKLADGTRLSAFALTEPGAGSDLTALKTTAVLDGDEYVVNGEKLFITNAVPGRTIGLVCKIEDVPSVLIVDLPEHENEHFQLNRYGIYALQRAHNNGLIFKNFRVPKANLLRPQQGDGLTVAYHGLNLGRVALCANASGTMRWMLAEMLPWAAYRSTYGQSIDQRELVRRRIARMAGLIVGCDALTQWCAGLLDQGYRGEMECIIAKIFGSEAQKEAAIELFMKTHGGRSFLHGHLFGDNVHEFLAPCIYEGEGEMLGMAFFKSLVKDHGKRFFEPIGRTLHELNVRKPNPLNPKHAWALKGPLSAYARWYAQRRFSGSHWTDLPSMPSRLRGHAMFGKKVLSKSAFKVSGTMRHHQLKLADRQCRMSALSAHLQHAITIVVTSLYAASSSDAVTQQAADILCSELRRKMTGAAASDADFRRMTGLGATITNQGWDELQDVVPGKIMMPYQSA